MNKKEYLLVKNVDAEKKKKASFVLSCKGKNLSVAVREMVDSLAKEFDQTNIIKGDVTNEEVKN